MQRKHCIASAHNIGKVKIFDKAKSLIAMADFHGTYRQFFEGNPRIAIWMGMQQKMIEKAFVLTKKLKMSWRVIRGRQLLQLVVSVDCHH